METCSLDEMKFIGTVMKQWCPVPTSQVRSLISTYILSGTRHHSIITKLYLHHVRQLAPWMLELSCRDICVNGFMYYISNLLFAMCHFIQLEKIHGDRMWIIVEQRVAKISLVCVIADFVLDTSIPENKAIIGHQIYYILKNIDKPLVNTGDDRVHSAGLILQSLIRDIPTALPCVVATFTAEIASIRQDKKLSYTELLSIERTKGAMTYELVGVIINNGVSLNVPAELGYVIQLYDDLADMYIDEKEGTWTMVSAAIHNDGSVDRIIYEMSLAIHKLPFIYWPFKVLCCIFIAAITSTNPYVSPTITKLLYPYSLMVNRGKDREDIPIYRNSLYDHIEYNIV